MFQPESLSTVPPAWTLRPLGAADRAAVLRLNADNWPDVGPFNAVELDQLLRFDGYHLVAVDQAGVVIGYLLSFPRESGYDDTEMSQHRRLHRESFCYVCQVAIAPEYRRRGIGRAFYAAVADFFRQRGTVLLCTDVNTDPPNPESLAFHRRLGFAPVATGFASNGFAIAFLARRL